MLKKATKGTRVLGLGLKLEKREWGYTMGKDKRENWWWRGWWQIKYIYNAIFYCRQSLFNTTSVTHELALIPAKGGFTSLKTPKIDIETSKCVFNQATLHMPKIQGLVLL